MDKISGDERLKILKQLCDDKTLIRVNIEDVDQEYTFIIADIRTTYDASYFRVDYSEDIKEDLPEINTFLRFEFIGKDRVKYCFNAMPDNSLQSGIWLKFPDFIERLQRRKNFRIDVPIGTTVLFGADSYKDVMDVINISVGGVCSVIARGRTNKIYTPETEFVDNVLVFHDREGEQQVHVEKVQIRRVEKNRLTNRRYYGIEFIEINRKEESNLAKLIYAFQRNALRYRLKD